MPALLKRDTIRLLETSVEALHLAVSSLATPKRTELRQESASFAAEIGLIGSAAELAMAGCVVQALGPSALIATNGQFKTFREILSEYRSLVRLATPGSEFLSAGLADPTEHRQHLLEAVRSFSVLSSARAGGLHAGKGLVWEAMIVETNAVSNLMELLAESSKIRPYLEYIPKLRFATEDRMVIIEDLAQRIRKSRGDERSRLLASIYIVLPDLPDEEPDWLEVLDRVSVSPKEQDISYLLQVMEQAIPASLRRTSQPGGAIPVAVRPEHPNALPIAPQHLRRQFNEISEQLYADIGNANGRLQMGIIDLPPSGAVVELFAIGLQRAGVLNQHGYLQPHESWPFIASSLSVSGTPGPYWFLLRETKDYGQLKSLLDQAREIGNARLGYNIVELESGIQAIDSGEPVGKDDSTFGRLLDDIGTAEAKRDKLMDSVVRNRGTSRAFPESLESEIEDVVEHHEPVGAVLTKLLAVEAQERRLMYWVRGLSSCALDIEDLPGLVAPQAWSTEVRKALRRIDFRTYGPQVIS